MNAETKDFGLIGTKLGMTQVFDEEGNVVPVTIIQLAENIVTEIRSKEKDGYDALQVGAFVTKEKHLTKPQIEALKKKNLPLLRKLKEFRTVDAIAGINIGDEIKLEEFFQDLEMVSITGKSIGKGFQGGVKLHNMHIGRRSHGSKSKRQIGSIGPGTDPGNVKKGKKMPSMMGNRIVTVTKSRVFNYDAEKRVLLVRGAVPGKSGNVVSIKAYGNKAWNYKNKTALAA